MNKVINLKTKKLSSTSDYEIGQEILNNIYLNYKSGKGQNEYSLILDILKKKKTSIYTKRDNIFFEFLFKYKKSYDFLVNLQWDNIDVMKSLIIDKSVVNTKIDNELLKRLLEYKKIKKTECKYVFSKNNEKLNEKFLKNLYNRYKKEIERKMNYD